MCFQMVSIYNLENAGRKLKPYHLVCLQEYGSTIDSGEKGYKLLEQILFNFLPLFSTLGWTNSVFNTHLSFDE